MVGLNDDPRFPERGQYVFLQGLVRTIAYGTLSRKDRKSRHVDRGASPGRHLARGGAGYRRGPGLALPGGDQRRPRGEDVAALRASARETLTEAGRAAASLALGAEADRYLAHAAELADDDLQRAQLLDQAGRALRASGDPVAAEQRLRRAIELHERGGTALGGPAAIMLANVVRYAGRVDEARDLLDRFRSADTAGTDAVTRAEGLAELAVTQINAGQMDDASRLTEEALAVLEDEQAWGPLSSGLITRAVYLILSHRSEEGYGVLRHALELAERHDLPQVALRARYNLAAVSIEQGRLDDAVDDVAAGLALARERGDRHWERQLIGQQIAPLTMLGRWNEAAPLALALLRGDMDSDAVFGAAYLSQIALARGEPEVLADCVATADERRESEHIDQRCSAWIVIARVALERGDMSEVQRLVTEVLEVPALPAEVVDELFELSIEAGIRDGDEAAMAERQSYLDALRPARATPLRRAGSLRLAAERAHLRGDEAIAVRAEADAEALLRRVGAKPRLASCLLERARRREEVEALVEARTIYGELGATHWLERVDREFGAVRMSATAELRCGGCGELTPAGRFCIHCGTPTLQACPACGASVVPGARFCLECGAALTGAGPAGGASVAAAVSQAQRRLVSVLFADLVGFTTLSEHRDPEEVRELLSQYFDRCRSLIERYGGTVEKFIGDAVMAVWGTPVAREDDAERAVRAALALTSAVTLLGEEVGMPELRVRAGVLTGNAAVEVGAEGEGMVLGGHGQHRVAAAVDRRSRAPCWSTT